MRSSPVHHLILVCAVALLAACPSKRKIASPEPPVPRNGDQEALRQFEDSQAQFRKGAGEVDPSRFEAIVAEFPDDPIVPHALLYAGMSSVRAGEYKKAIGNLDQLVADDNADEALLDRGLFYRGLAKNYTGDHAGAIRDLRAGEDSVGQTDGEREEWLAAMAIAHAGAGQIASALGFYDSWYKAGKKSERAFILAQLDEAIGKLSDEDLAPTYDKIQDKKGPSAAFAGRRLAGVLRGKGDTDGAERIESETKDARSAFGLATSVGGDADTGDPNRVGGILPLSGRQSRIGEYVGRGVALAASFGGKEGGGAKSGWPRRFSLVLRDSTSSADKAVASLKELAAEDVVAVIGPVRRDSSRQVAEAASAMSLPIVTLAGVPTETDSAVRLPCCPFTRNARQGPRSPRLFKGRSRLRHSSAQGQVRHRCWPGFSRGSRAARRNGHR